MRTPARPAVAGDRPSAVLLFVLVVVTALGPFAMQIFLPALPAIRSAFGVGAGAAQLAFSLSAFSIAIATLAYGPLSDRHGRRPVLLAGLGLYLAGSLLCLVAPSIGVLVLGRIVQAAGGAAGMVLARAVVQDLYGRERAASVLAYLTMAMVVAPMIAPALGGVLTDHLGWRANFAAGAVVGLAALALGWQVLIETHAGRGMSIGPAAIVRSFANLLRNRAFTGYAFQGAFSLSLFFAFLAGAPFVMIEVMGRGATEYGLWFISISAAFMVGNFLAARVSGRVGLDRMIVIGAALALAGVLGALVLTLVLPWAPAALFLPMAFTAFAQGIAIPNGQAGAVAAAPEIAGAASGLAGFLQMAMAAVAAQLVGMIQDGTPYPTLAAMLVCAAGALLAITWALRARPPRRGSGPR